MWNHVILIGLLTIALLTVKGMPGDKYHQCGCGNCYYRSMGRWCWCDIQTCKCQHCKSIVAGRTR